MEMWRLALSLFVLIHYSLANHSINEVRPNYPNQNVVTVELFDTVSTPNLLTAVANIGNVNQIVFQQQVQVTGNGYDTYEVPFPPDTNYLGIILNYRTTPINNYNQLTSNIYDTFLFSRDGNTQNPFSDIIPEWNGKALPVDNYSRCETTRFNPDAFERRLPTLGALNNCLDDVIEGDPHFIQTVQDSKTNQTISICYDVSGESQQSIFILKDNDCDTRIEGILFDDYYMHEIVVYHYHKKISVHHNKIIFDNEEIVWKEEKFSTRKFLFENIEILLQEKYITLRVWKENELKLSILIKKSVNNFGIDHLDVGFEFLDRKDQLGRYEGIIGDIQNKKFEKMNDSQFDGDERIVLKVDERIIYGRERRNLSVDHKCILVPFNEIIKPKSTNDYIRLV